MADNHLYTPRDDFRANLEWEVRRRFQHGASASPSRRTTTYWAKAAAVVGISVAIGASAGFASAQIRQTSTRDSLLQAAAIDATLAKTRLEIAQAQANEVTAKVRVGAADQSELAAAVSEMREMEWRWNAAALNVEEISKSGASPRDDLGAPLVAGRDYVMLRLQLEAAGVQSRLTTAELAVASSERRTRAGVEDDGVLQFSRLKLQHVQGELSVLAEELKARKEFLELSTPPAELAQRIELAQVRSDAAYAQAELNAAKVRLTTVERLNAAGTASDVDLLRAQLAVKQLQVELQRLAVRLRAAK